MRKPSASTYPSVKRAPGTAVAVGSCVCTTGCLLPRLAPNRSVHVVLRGPTIACSARLVQPQGQRCSAAQGEACRRRIDGRGGVRVKVACEEGGRRHG